MISDDPYGLPTFPGEEVLALDGWTDHSEIQLRDVRVFTRSSVTVTLIHHPGLWDFIMSDGAGTVDFSIPQTNEIAAAFARL